MYEKFVQGCPPTQTPTQKFQNEFLISGSHGIMDILVSFVMISQALQTELSRFMIDRVWSKIPKFPEFSLPISSHTIVYDHKKIVFISKISLRIFLETRPLVVKSKSLIHFINLILLEVFAYFITRIVVFSSRYSFH